MPPRAGRLPSQADRDAVVVNDAFVSAIGADPGDSVGRRIRLRRQPAGPATPWLTIAGVIPSVRQTPMGDARPCVYVPLAHEPGLALAVMLRGQVDAASLAPALRRVVAGLDGDLAVYNVATLADLSHTVRWAPRTVSLVLSIFGLVAFALSMAGVYAVTASGLAHRTHEIGIRLTLGAARRHVVGLVAGRVVPAVALGLVLGLAGGGGLTQVLRGVPIGHNAGGAVPLALIALAVVAVVACACGVLVRRALRVDPSQTLRAE